MNVLITRSYKENLYLKKDIISRIKDIKVEQISLIKYKNLHFDLSCFLCKFGNKKIICTSKFCSQILSKSININCNCEVLAVGEESARILSKNKFITKIQTFSNCANLKRSIDYSQVQNYLYVSGNFITEDIPDIERKEIYKVEYKSKLNKKEIEAIKKSNVILFFSENTTKYFIDLLKKYRITDYIKDSLAVGISEKSVLAIENNVKKILYSKNHSKKEIIDILNEIRY